MDFDSQILNEYKAVRESGGGILDFPNRGLIEVSGSEAVQFLNGLITNDIAKLEDNSWMLAAFPNVQGRLLANVRVLRRGDKFLFDTEAATYQKVFQNLFRFTFAGDFKVTDLSPEMNLISIQGKRAEEIFNQVFGNHSFAKSGVLKLSFEDKDIFIIRATHTAENGFDLFVPTNLREKLSSELLAGGAIRISDKTQEVLRIEAGIPRYGVDMDETTVVLETGLDEAVSFTKGCYIGQEVIIRIHHRGRVAKKLSGLILEETADIQPNDELQSNEGKAAGRVTSVTISPALNKQIALAYVRHEFLAPETELIVLSGENQTKARVTELPFVRGSWY